MMMRILTRALACSILLSHCLMADEAFKPAVMFDMGGKKDKSFNEAAFNGAEAFKKKTGVDYLEFEITSPTLREKAMRSLLEKGANVLVVAGFNSKIPMETVAKDFPNVKFNLIDNEVKIPNGRSVVFKEQEGSFLAGALAARKSKTGTISFLGGMDISLIKKFECGYVLGAQHANNKINVLVNYIGTDPSSWNDPVKGSEIAKSQFGRGSDIIYAAAGASGLGAYQAAKDQGKLAIGVDSNQNYLFPGTMLTSMLKRVDLAFEKILTDAKDGKWQPGLEVLGLKEGGVDLAFDEHNVSLISEDDKKFINALKKDIIDGKVTVHDYTSDSACPSK